MNAQQYQQQGNAALFQGRFDNAIQYFRQSILISSQDDSISLLDYDHDDDSQSIVDRDARDTIGTASSSIQPIMESITLNLSEIVMKTSSETISSHNIFDLFDRAFLALPGASAAMSSVICIYNIALTHHTQAMLRTCNSSYHFQRAYHFYDLAWKALPSCCRPKQRWQPKETMLQDPTLLPIMLALLNNMGHISAHFWNRADVKAALQGIFEVIPSYLEYQSSHHCYLDVLFFSSYRCYEYVETLNHAPSA